MKKLILTVALVASCAVAFGQGKVAMIGDSASPIILTTDSGLYRSADSALAGQAIGNSVSLPSGVVLMAGLYAGTSSTSLSLATSVLLTSAVPAGTIPSTRVTLTGIAGIASGTAIGASTPWFQVKVWDSAYANYDLAKAAGSYIGQNALFQMNPGNSIAYVSTAPPGVNTTWTDSPIVVSLVPEPSSFALAGLGAAALMIFRRRR